VDQTTFEKAPVILSLGADRVAMQKHQVTPIFKEGVPVIQVHERPGNEKTERQKLEEALYF
jgi:hypothetical protein